MFTMDEDPDDDLVLGGTNVDTVFYSSFGILKKNKRRKLFLLEKYIHMDTMHSDPDQFKT